MKKIRQIHFWVGIITAAFLFVQSITGIVLYFQQKGGDKGGQPMAMQQSNSQNAGSSNSSSKNTNNSSTSSNTNTNNSSASSNSNTMQAPSFNGSGGPQNGNFPNGGMMQRQAGGAGSLEMLVKSLHSGIIGLIAGIGMLILTGTGLWTSWLIARAKRKRKRDVATAS